MNRVTVISLAVIVVAFGLYVYSQQFSASMGVGSLTGCPAPTSGSNIMCSVTDGVYASINGAAYAKINASAGGVQSFNGRTGPVVSAVGDYAFSDLKNPPTSFTCTSGQAGNTGISGSGCTFK